MGGSKSSYKRENHTDIITTEEEETGRTVEPRKQDKAPRNTTQKKILHLPGRHVCVSGHSSSYWAPCLCIWTLQSFSEAHWFASGPREELAAWQWMHWRRAAPLQCLDLSSSVINYTIPQSSTTCGPPKAHFSVCNKLHYSQELNNMWIHFSVSNKLHYSQELNNMWTS